MLPDLLKKQKPADWETIKVCFCRAPISYPFNPFTCRRAFFTIFFFFHRCLWILSTPLPITLQAIFFFQVNFFQKVNSKLPLPTLQKSPKWTVETLFQYKLPLYLCQKLPYSFHVYVPLNNLYLENYCVHWAINIQEKLLNFFLKHSLITRTMSSV